MLPSSHRTIFLVRHGESESNVAIADAEKRTHGATAPDIQALLDEMVDPKLTFNGRMQAEITGNYLAQLLQDTRVHVMTSVMQRTIDTAAPFIELHSTHKIVKTTSEPLLLEHTRPTRHMSQEHFDRGFRAHNTWKDFTDQVVEFVDFLENISDTTPPASPPIVIFGHSWFFSVMLSYLASGKRYLPESHHDLTFRLPNCSISTLQLRADADNTRKWLLLHVSSVSHLPADLRTGVECQWNKRVE